CPMNRIYKVIYSKARQCYIVVSELAKSNHKSSQQGADHTNTPALARIIAVALAAGALTWGSVPGVSWAADTKTGSGDGVAIGTGSTLHQKQKMLLLVKELVLVILVVLANHLLVIL
ncbi:ESPR domain-containing protein, partial [Mitsuokella multacida]|uniref:ESPR domain-containing protein n=1 Tax=Mitsuokella multacida TaxID=52226 RepID=UPI0022DF0EC1